MHEPKASAWRNLNRCCIILVHTLKHTKPVKCVLSVLLRLGDLSAIQMCGTQMNLLTDCFRLPSPTGCTGDGGAKCLKAAMADPTNGKLVHLDGLNLSHMWMLEGIAAGLP